METGKLEICKSWADRPETQGTADVVAECSRSAGRILAQDKLSFSS